MNTLRIRNTELTPGKPKIVVPLTGTYSAGLIHECSSALSFSCDMVEWRLDYYLAAIDDIQQMLNSEKLYAELLKCLDVMRFVLKDTPIIVTLRSKEQGGIMDVDAEHKRFLMQVIAQSKLADIIDLEYGDVERAMLDEENASYVSSLKEQGAAIMISHHDFKETPSAETMVGMAARMKSLGADICKFAAMANNEDDVRTMEKATAAIASQDLDPVAGFCMGEEGQITRITCGLYGSCLTYASLSEAVAPGQIDIRQMREAIDKCYTEQESND